MRLCTLCQTEADLTVQAVCSNCLQRLRQVMVSERGRSVLPLLHGIIAMSKNSPPGSLPALQGTLAAAARDFIDMSVYRPIPAQDRVRYVYMSSSVRNPPAIKQEFIQEIRSWLKTDSWHVEILDPADIDPVDMLPATERIERNLAMIEQSCAVLALPPIDAPSPGTWGEVFWAASHGRPVIVWWTERVHTWLHYPGIMVHSTPKAAARALYSLVLGGDAPETVARRWSS